MQPPPLPADPSPLRGVLIATAVCLVPLLAFAVLGTMAERLRIDGLATFAFALLGLSLLADGVLFVVALGRAVNGTPGGWAMLGVVTLFWVAAVVYVLKQMSLL